MQVLKEETKKKIIDAAVEEFLINGFENSSLRTIAAQAGTTIGNIYSYFSSKDDLFTSVVKPAADALDSLLSLELVNYKDQQTTDLTSISNQICELFIANKDRFFILMNGSSGSRFENAKDDIVDFISDRFEKELFPSLDKKDIDPLFALVLASSLLTGFLTIFNHYGGDRERLMSLINSLLTIFLRKI